MPKIMVTHDLNVVCIDQGTLVQRRIDRVENVSQLACVVPVGKNFSIAGLDQESWFDFATQRIDRAVPGGEIDLISADYSIFGLKFEERYMRADQFSGIDFSAREIQEWEKFRLFEIEEYNTLVRLITKKWTFGKKIITVDIEKSDFMKISIDNNIININEFMSLFNEKEVLFDFIFHSEWKIFRASIVNPAIVFVVFGRNRTLKEFEISIRSLDDPGEYDGDIYVITDLSKNTVLGVLPHRFVGKTTVINKTARDALDYVGARLSIFQSPILNEYQPILYSDCDVIFDKPIEEFICVSAQSRCCSAQVEAFSDFKTSLSTGSSLFTEDPFDIDDVNGFNGGIFMIPNMRHHGKHLSAAYTALRIYTSAKGRDSIPFYDQSILNYSLYKLGDFEASPVTERTRIGGMLREAFRPYCNADPNNPKGFVHFWNSDHRSTEMLAYLSACRRNN